MRAATRKRNPGWLIACALLPLGACDSAQPSGQVVAVVDGTELTRRELREELPAGLRGSIEQQEPAVNQALEGLIDRKLLAGKARDLGLETDPEFHFALRQAREQLLVAALRRHLAGGQSQPTAAEVDGFIAARPSQFAQRKQFVLVPVDQTEAPPAFVDSADFGGNAPDWAGSARVGTTFPWGGTEWRVAAIYPLQVSVADQRLAARRIIEGAHSEMLIRRMLNTLRSQSEIRYQPGFGPSGR